MSMIKTFSAWQLEALFVATTLALTAVLSGSRLTDWVGAVAVFFTFMHGQISFDFAEDQSAKSAPDVSCHRWSGRYFVVKEALWVLTFTLLEAWPLLIGTVVFLTYPKWRTAFRSWRGRRL
jgi:hypothetical protein